MLKYAQRHPQFMSGQADGVGLGRPMQKVQPSLEVGLSHPLEHRVEGFLR